MAEEPLSDFHPDPARGCQVGFCRLPSLAGYGARLVEGSEVDARHFRKGVFRIEVRGEGGGPLLEQTRALGHLLEHEDQVCTLVLRAVLDAYRAAYEDCHVERNLRSVGGLRPLVRCTRVEVARAHSGGQAYLGFHFQTGWRCERGLCVVFHPQRGAWWDDSAGLERVEEEPGADVAC
jgi:hypothetical protein